MKRFKNAGFENTQESMLDAINRLVGGEVFYAGPHPTQDGGEPIAKLYYDRTHPGNPFRYRPTPEARGRDTVGMELVWLELDRWLVEATPPALYQNAGLKNTQEGMVEAVNRLIKGERFYTLQDEVTPKGVIYYDRDRKDSTPFRYCAGGAPHAPKDALNESGGLHGLWLHLDRWAVYNGPTTDEDAVEREAQDMYLNYKNLMGSEKNWDELPDNLKDALRGYIRDTKRKEAQGTS